jgi:hypothetical protein
MLEEKIDFLTNMTSTKILEYNKAVKIELESIITDLENKLIEYETVISNKKKELKLAETNGSVLKNKVNILEIELGRLKTTEEVEEVTETINIKEKVKEQIKLEKKQKYYY